MTPEHEQQAKAAERELADMEERADRLGDRIEEARDDWEAKKRDSSVPGAGGDPERAEQGGRHPETAYPGKGPDDEMTDADPTDNDRGVDDTPRDHAGGEERGGAEAGAGSQDEQRGEGAPAG